MKKYLAMVSLTVMLGGFTASAMENLLAEEPSASNARPPQKGRMFEEADKNGDHVLSKEEFVAFHTKEFTKIDSDHNAQISEEEMQAFHQEKHPPHREEGPDRREEGPDRNN